MEIAQQLLKFKYHILAGLTVAAVLYSLTIIAPSFLSILSYFWPLLLSTVVFLVAGVFFGKTSPSPLGSGSDSDSASEMAGEGLLNYVAGQPEFAFDT